MNKTRVGLIGYGLWGQHHAAAIAKCPHAELAGIVAVSEESRAAASDAWGSETQVVADYRQICESPEIDAVDIVVPSHLHFKIAAAALRADKHVLLEKPMTIRSEDSRQLAALAAERDRILAIGFELRLSDLWGRVHRMISAGAIGEPLYALIELWRRPYRPGSQAWRFDIKRVGSWVLEEPIHFFDLARWYFESFAEPVSVYAVASSKQVDHPELHDNFSAVLKFSNGGQALITQTLAAYQHHQTAKLTGSRGALRAAWSGAMDRDPHPRASLEHFDGETLHEIPLEKPTGELYELEAELEMFVAAVRSQSPPAADPQAGIWSIVLCEAAHESIKTGLEVAVGADA